MGKMMPARKAHAGLFRPGNDAAVGNRGRMHSTAMSQVLTSILNELDKETNKAKMYKLCGKLYDLAVGYSFKKKEITADGIEVIKEVVVQPDINAIREVFDRVEGKARQQVTVTGADDGPVQFEDVTAAREKLGKLLELKVVSPQSPGGGTGGATGDPLPEQPGTTSDMVTRSAPE